MDLAVRTTASPGAIWTIVVVAVVLLAFWLFMVMVYANRPDPRFRQLAGMSSAATGDAGAGAAGPAGAGGGCGGVAGRADPGAALHTRRRAAAGERG